MFIDTVLTPLRRRLPSLRVVMEHITTQEGVEYARDSGPNLGATITTHHLILNRNHLLVGGIRPHYYCLPVAKREKHRLALRAAATSGEACFFLGTDSATNTMPLLAHVFEDVGALSRLEAFASLNGPAFYRLPLNVSTLRLVKHETPQVSPEKIFTEAGPVTLFNPGFPVHWSVES